MAFVLGITGGIGTGKSTVLEMFARLGAQTLSADDIARDVLAKDEPAYREVVARFGERVLTEDGEIDRPALAAAVFGDSGARAALNGITHPRIIAALESEIERFRRDHPERGSVLAVEVPLLVECDLRRLVDQVLLVAAEQETQVSRLTSRSGISHEEALQRIGAQMPIKDKIDYADRVVWNDGALESLEQSIKGVWEEIGLL